MRFLAYAVIAALALYLVNAHAEELGRPDIPVFDTPEAAAMDGFKQVIARPLAPVYEFGGQIVRTAGGKYAALKPRTDFSGDSVRIDEGTGFIEDMMGIVQVGSYHTHPCIAKHLSAYFSPPDLYEAIYQRRLVFMGDLCTGYVHEFKPGDKPDVDEVDDGLWLSKGRILGKFTTAHPVQPE